jgi:hypothetical protein
MSDETKTIVHTIHGYIPKRLFQKFIRENFQPGFPSEEVEAETSPGICEIYGCPASHPISGTALKTCDIDIDDRGQIAVNCYYEAIQPR